MSAERPTLFQNLRALPASAWVLFAGTFVNRFGTFVMPFLVLYLTRGGYSDSQAGLAVGFYGLEHVAASSLGGYLADRFGRRNTIAVSMFGSTIAMLALSQARGYLLILVLTFVSGLFAELYRPASYALIADLVPPERRIAAFGMYRFAVNLGFAAGPATAGFLADRSFFYVFVGDAVTSLGYGIIALAFLPHGLRVTMRGERPGEALRSAARDRRFLLFLLGTALVTSVDFQMGSTFALHVKAHGFPGSTYGLLVSFNGVLIVLFELMITAWTQRTQPQAMIALGYLLTGIGFALTGLAHTIPALAATVVIWTMGEMVSSPVTGAYVSHLAPEHLRGRYHGLWVLMWSIGMVVGPTVGTLVFERNPTALWAGCGVIGVVSAGLVMMTARR